MKIAVFGNKEISLKLFEEISQESSSDVVLVTLNYNKRKSTNISGGFNTEENLLKGKYKIYQSQTYSLNSESDLEYFRCQCFDVGLCTGWQRLIPSSVLDTFKHGVFGWHGSAFNFPNGRGRSPINWSIRLGQAVIKHNMFRYDQGADDGPIFETAELDIGDTDHVSDVLNKAHAHILGSGKRLITALDANINIDLRHQPHCVGLYFPKLSETDGEIFLNFTKTLDAYNIIRSCSRPFPGAYVVDGGNTIKLWHTSGYSLEEVNQVGCEFSCDGKLKLFLSDGVLLVDEFEVV